MRPATVPESVPARSTVPVRQRAAFCASIVIAMMPSLETRRLLLRPLQADDLDALAPLHAECSFWQYPLRRGQTTAETGDFLDGVLDHYATHDFGFAAVVDQVSGDLTGWAGLSVPAFLPEVMPAVEVGWRLGPAWRGRGYATEAGAAWVEWGFKSLGLAWIHGSVMAKPLGGRERRGMAWDSRPAPFPASGTTGALGESDLREGVDATSAWSWPRRGALGQSLPSSLALGWCRWAASGQLRGQSPQTAKCGQEPLGPRPALRQVQGRPAPRTREVAGHADVTAT